MLLFDGQGTLGTRADVHWGRPPADTSHLDYWSDAEAQCWLWQDRDGAQARCYNAGRAIAFCGHGLLACAYLWSLERGEPPAFLSTGKTRFRVLQEGGKPWLIAPRPAECRPCPSRPSWFGEPPTAAWAVGEENGYIVLQWDAGFDLRGLTPNHEAICRDTDRAVIATSKSLPGKSFDVGLRYFAPQYGNPEDSVTGSACVVLADFWPGENLRFRQYSERGGLVKVRKGDNTVSITGAMHRL